MRAWIYSRISEFTSVSRLDNKLECLKQYADMLSYEIVGVSSEITNQCPSNREAITRIRDLCKQNKIDLLLVDESMSLSNNKDTLKRIVNNLDNVGCCVLSSTEGLLNHSVNYVYSPVLIYMVLKSLLVFGIK